VALPINISELIHGKTIESERLEFKQGWNPEDIIHSMCAFANDIHNWGGGYIIVGIEEDNGQPILPPAGLPQHKLDDIQKEIIQLGHRISPNYFPITAPYLIDGEHILVLWCPAGDHRIYDAPTTLGSKAQRQPYIRITSNSIIAKGVNLQRLQELTARIPFDDRVNNKATMQDLDLGLMREYLQEIKSELFDPSAAMDFNDLCRTMLIAKGPDEDIRPVNVGLLFFSKEPQRFFDRSRIELVIHHDDSGKSYDEYIFEGPIHKQLRDTLSFIKTNIISEHVVKVAGQAESERYYNYPYAAIEEALANAVYHKSYELGSPIEIQIFVDHMTILSYPCPVPPVNAKILETKKRIIAREYRNRRIGDFLKELKLTEGRGTGLPAIYNAMMDNGSDKPSFETDNSSYVLVTLPCHEAAINNGASNQASNGASNGANLLVFSDLEEIVAYCNNQSNQASNGASNGARESAKAIISSTIHNKVEEVLQLSQEWINRGDLFDTMGLTNQSTNRKKYLDPLLELEWIQLEYPQNLTHPNQRYKVTESGARLLALIATE
jgi:ATP-dependent DNA helicase RecG